VFRPCTDPHERHLGCCLAYQLPLATFNLNDFEDFAEHHGMRLLEPQPPTG
jgi:hypothetical protein